MSSEAPGKSITVWTIGHSTRTSDEFERLIAASHITQLVDVRSYPTSKRYPQFNREELFRSLARAGVVYHHFASLGGRRKPSPHSKNTAWKNESFRAYADYMETEEFKSGVEELLEVASTARTAIMCAEALWWRCHRGLIADYLKAHAVEVRHIIAASHIEVHPYTGAARIVNGLLSYRGLQFD